MTGMAAADVARMRDRMAYRGAVAAASAIAKPSTQQASAFRWSAML
jgi:hypothetical protein